MRTIKRFEYKYRISYKDYMVLQPLISKMMLHDRHGPADEYPVRSIYLDDVYFTGAADKAFGNELHKKYRIRYYHKTDARTLELKEKINNNTTKYSTNITEPLYQAILDQDLTVLETYFHDPLVRRLSLDMLRFHLTPSCMIVYQREAYMDQENNCRVTFDHSLQVSREIPDYNPSFINLIQPSDMILEVKYEHFLPKEIKTILNKVTLNQIAVSKYFLGYAQITP